MSCKRIILCALIVFLSGCASNINKKMESWVGSHESDLIASWGPPQQVSDNGQGGKVLVYQNYVNLGQTQGVATSDGYGNTRFSMPQSRGYNRTRMFYVNEAGYIYSFRWQGM